MHELQVTDEPDASSPWRNTPRRQRPYPVGFVEPRAPIKRSLPLTGPRWFHEIKQDGYRIIARRDGLTVRLWTRNRVDCTARFLRIVAALLLVPATSFLVDGEAIDFQANGHSDLHRLRSRAGAESAGLVAFDLLELNGADLRADPIEFRRARLATLLPSKAVAGDALRFSHGFDGEGAAIFAKACLLGLEGIVSKLRGSPYRGGRNPAWVKTLNPDYARA